MKTNTETTSHTILVRTSLVKNIKKKMLTRKKKTLCTYSRNIHYIAIMENFFKNYGDIAPLNTKGMKSVWGTHYTSKIVLALLTITEM